ncbi:MAG: transglutaminase domain-containing protein [Chloroflexi bacterium]|nr:transglutaminase domain-containing protein [Chloroflexota bacterium]
MDVVVLAAAALLVAQAPLSVVQAGWVPNLDPLPRFAIGGLLVGYVIERTRVPAIFGLLLGWILGFELVVYVYAQLPVVGSLNERVDWVGGRVGAWADAISGGGVSNDPLVFALAMAGLAWFLGVITAWLIFRDNSPWLAVVFNGVALMMNLSYAPAGLVNYVSGFAFSACLVLAAQQLAIRTELWQRAQLGVNWRVVANVLVGTGVAAGLLLSTAWALPSNVSSPAVSVGWSRVTAPWQDLEQEFDRWFAALNGTDQTARGLSFGRTLAPRGAFDLGDTPVLQVTAGQPLYLRATTADRYGGQAITSSETTSTSEGANADLLTQDTIPLGRAPLQADIKVLASKTSVAFAPDAPVRFSQSTEVDTRGAPDDLATVRLDNPVQQNQDYTVVSAISVATNQDLRAAGENYPDSIRQRYLELPRRLPRRVVDLAHQATNGDTNAFDKAVGLESYLRDNFTYSTHVAAVPPDQDWADYFLFESKQGYCDYFATAMVVLLRVEGVPARVASGFAPGDFDPSTGISIVRENHAHSWVEAYFPRYGWITFEPSSIRPIPQRLEAPPDATSAEPPPPASDASDRAELTPEELDELLGLNGSAVAAPSAPTPFWETLAGAFLLFLGVVLILGLVATAVVAVAWRRGLGALALYQRPYAQLIRLGRWSGTLRPRTSDTPFEVSSALGRQIPRAREAIDDLTAAYVEGTYAGRTPAADPWPAWVASRRDVIRALFRRRLGGWLGEDASVESAPRSHPELLRQLRSRRPKQ